MSLAPDTPVLIGVGTASESVEPSELMALALEAAADDAGNRSVLRAIDRIAVPKGTWSYPDPARLVATRVGARRARSILGEIGVTQQSLITDALTAVASGASDIAAVVGGEARAWARLTGAVETEQPGAVPDVTETREPEFIADPEIAAGIVIPPYQQYAVIENALIHEEHVAPSLGEKEIAALWGRLNVIARTNPRAAFPNEMTPEDLIGRGPGNRPLAFPYNRWHASQWTVDQAAALIVCRAEVARSHGIPLDRWIFPRVALDANHSVSLSRRRYLHRWPAMGVLGLAAAKRIGRPLADVEHTEVYSCFPSAVRVQQRELSLPLDGTPSITGGMAFAGGPFNNFVYQATAAMAERVRTTPKTLGMVTTVCGLLTKPGLAIWACEPDGSPPLIDDLAQAAQEATPTCTVLDSHQGGAGVVGYTVTYEETRPTRTVVIADVVASQIRAVGVSSDPDLAARAEKDGLIGETVTFDGMTVTP